MTKLRVLDLFSGIGGFSLGLERTGGFETVAFCEIDPFCRRVLAKHWPDVRQFEDVTKLKGEDVGPVDVICGGFPCQDISLAGKGAGLAGERSGLWREYARLVGELRPEVIIVENVTALLSRGLGDILGDLAALGYDAEWHGIPASAIGFAHIRDRVWIIGHLADAKRVCKHIAQRGCASEAQKHGAWSAASRGRVSRLLAQYLRSKSPVAIEPNVGRVAHGVPYRVERNRALGNAVVPQIPELIGRAILAAQEAAA